MTRRHNRIVDRIKKASAKSWTVLRENQAIAGSSLRPDLVITKGDSAIVIDVAIPFENGTDAFTRTRREKERKYANIVAELKNRYSDVKFEACIVGALGSWDPANDRLLKRLCSKKYACLMRRLCVSDVICASRDLYTEFITGVPQHSTQTGPNIVSLLHDARHPSATVSHTHPFANATSSTRPSTSSDSPTLIQTSSPAPNDGTPLPPTGEKRSPTSNIE